MLARGLRAALAVVGGETIFGQLHVFTMDAVDLIPDSRTGRAPGPPAERWTRPRDSGTRRLSLWKLGKVFYPPALLVCGANEWLSGTVYFLLGRHWAKASGTCVYRPDWPLCIELGCPEICPRLQGLSGKQDLNFYQGHSHLLINQKTIKVKKSMSRKHQGSELNQHIRVIQRLAPGRQRFTHNPIHLSSSTSPLVVS